MNLSVVATTHQNSTCSMLTLAKLTEGYLVVRIIRELNKEPSVIKRECGQTLARVRISWTKIVSIIISLQWMESM